MTQAEQRRTGQHPRRTAQAGRSAPAEGGQKSLQDGCPPQVRAGLHLVAGTLERSKHWSGCHRTQSQEADVHSVMFTPNWNITRVEKPGGEGLQICSRICLVEAERPSAGSPPPPEETEKGLKEEDKTFKASAEDIRAGSSSRTLARQPIPPLHPQPPRGAPTIWLPRVTHPARGCATTKPAKPKTAFQDDGLRARKSRGSATCHR